MAPLVMIGSTLLASPTAGASTRPATAAPATVQICKAAHMNGAFKFSVNGGRSISVGRAQCASVRTHSGINRVTEVSAPASMTRLVKIAVLPRAARISTSIKKATATLRLAARQNAKVAFTNAATPAGTGAVEVCKYPVVGDPYVTGSFSFTITAPSFTDTESVLVGQCTGPIAVPAGSVTITEAARFPYALASVATLPASALTSTNLTAQSATVAVTAGAQTDAWFYNKTLTGYVKACKTLASNSAALTGDTFGFTISSMWGTQDVSVVASAPGLTACAIDPVALPLGTAVSVTEDAQANVQITGVSVFPPSQDAGSTSAMANLIVGPNVTDAIFMNGALGWVEVCKAAADASTATQSFEFSVNGAAPFWVHAGQCSQPLQVPAGTAGIYEYPSANFHLASVSTVSPTDPTGSRLQTDPTTNPAMVSVPFGGIGNETVATFTNAVNSGDFKICKQQTSPDANLQGQTFNFKWSVDGYSGYVQLTVPLNGAACSGLIGGMPGIPVVDPAGNPVQITVSELTTPIPAVEVTNIDYEGNGTLVSSTPTPHVVSVPGGGSPASATFYNGQGINVVTFTNGRYTPSPVS